MSYALAALVDERAGAGEHAAAIAALCDVLALAGPNLFQTFPIQDFARRLPALVAAAEGDVPLLAARAIAEACEGMPQWAALFAKHGTVEALRDRLLAIDCMELAEEVLNSRAASLPPPVDLLIYIALPLFFSS